MPQQGLQPPIVAHIMAPYQDCPAEKIAGVLDVDHGSTREPGAEGAIGQSSCQRKGLVALFLGSSTGVGHISP